MSIRKSPIPGQQNATEDRHRPAYAQTHYLVASSVKTSRVTEDGERLNPRLTQGDFQYSHMISEFQSCGSAQQEVISAECI